MTHTRLPALRGIAAIVAMIFSCGITIAEPDQTSADYIMPGCRDAASLITFTNAGESKEDLSRMSLCMGDLLLALATWVSLTGYACHLARILSKPPASSFNTSTDRLGGCTRTLTL